MAADPSDGRRSAHWWSGPGSPYFSLSGDTDEFWNELDDRHAQHRRHLIYLGIISAVLILAGIVVHYGFLFFLAFAAMLAAVEWFMLRRTRPTSTVPDRRSPPTVEVDLDDR